MKTTIYVGILLDGGLVADVFVSESKEEATNEVLANARFFAASPMRESLGDLENTRYAGSLLLEKELDIDISSECDCCERIDPDNPPERD